MDIWTTLGIEPTQEITIIRKAYAAKLKLHHPESDAEGYQTLRKAYDAAMRMAKAGAVLNEWIHESVSDAALPDMPIGGDEAKSAPSFELELKALLEALNEHFQDAELRADLNAWSKLFCESDLIWNYECRNFVSEALLHWMLSNSYYMPKDVCRMFDEHFEWREVILESFEHYEHEYSRYSLWKYFSKLDTDLPKVQRLSEPEPTVRIDPKRSGLLFAVILVGIMTVFARLSSGPGYSPYDMRDKLASIREYNERAASTFSGTPMVDTSFDVKTGLLMDDTVFDRLPATGFTSLYDAKEKLPALVSSHEWDTLREYVLIDSMMEDFFLYCDDEQSMLMRLSDEIQAYFSDDMPRWNLKHMSESDSEAVLQYEHLEKEIRLEKRNGQFFFSLSEKSGGSLTLYQDLDRNALHQKLRKAMRVAVPLYMIESRRGMDLYVMIEEDESIYRLMASTNIATLETHYSSNYNGRVLVCFHSDEPFKRLIGILGVTSDGKVVRYEVVR